MIEERNTQCILQAPQPPGNGRLRDVQVGRSSYDGAVIDNVRRVLRDRRSSFIVYPSRYIDVKPYALDRNLLLPTVRAQVICLERIICSSRILSIHNNRESQYTGVNP